MRRPYTCFFRDGGGAFRDRGRLKGVKALLGLLGAESNWSVLKSEQSEEPFNRHSLMAAIQGARRHAHRDDVVMPRLVLPEVMERLRRSERRMRRRLTTATID